MSYLLVFRRYVPFSEFGGGFEGDNRTEASTDLNASARTIGIVPFGPDFVGGSIGLSSGTSHRSEAYNKLMRRLNRTQSDVDASVTIKTRNMEFVQFYAHTAGSNPYVPLSPDIDTFVDFRAVFKGESVEFTGGVTGDAFPNAEVIVYDPRRRPLLVFHFATSGGRNSGPGMLFGAGERNVLGAFRKSRAVNAEGCFA